MSLSQNEVQAAIAKAKKEVSEERMAKAVAELKNLYRQLAEAEVVVANIQREIEDYERAASDGNN